MTNRPLEQALLDVLFSFIQADRPADLRLIARLLQCTQRQVVASAWELSRSGLMVMATGALTAKGQRLAAEQRQRARTSWAGTAQAA